jgi:hypothetical protein
VRTRSSSTCSTGDLVDEHPRFRDDVDLDASVAGANAQYAAMSVAERDALALETGAWTAGRAAQDLAERYQDRGDLDMAARWWAVALDRGVVDMDSVRLELELAADPQRRAAFDEEIERTDAFFRRLFGIE